MNPLINCNKSILMYKKSHFLSVVIVFLYLMPSWTLENTFTVEVLNMQKYNQDHDDNYAHSRLEIGIGLVLLASDSTWNIAQQSNPIPMPYYGKLGKRTRTIPEQKTIHSLSIYLWGNKAISNESESKKEGLCSYDRLFTLQTNIAERDLAGSTIYVLFEGLRSNAPFNVVIVTDDEPLTVSRLFCAQKPPKQEGTRR